MKKHEISEVFEASQPRPEKLDVRVTVETKQKYQEMRNARAKLAPKIAKAIEELIEDYYQTFKKLGA